MIKVLFGINYDLARFVGIKSEMWARVTGKEPPITDTQFATGNIKINSITSDVGFVLDSDSIYFYTLGEPHLSRLVDVVDGDGWMEVTEETPQETPEEMI